MALFGKKKQAEPAAPLSDSPEDIQIVGAADDDVDFAETGDEANSGQTIDFDAIAQDLNAHEEGADMDSFLGRSGETAPGFDAPAANNGDINFETTFADASPALVNAAPTSENPFSNAPDIEAIDQQTVLDEPIYQEPALTTEAPMLTHTAPILTSDMAAAGGTTVVRRSPPLLPLLGAAGLLVALGVVGYVVFGGTKTPEEDAAPVVAASPPLQARTIGNTMDAGLAVDGVPIAPGAVAVSAGLPPTVALTPALQNQLKELWKQGAAAKRAGNIAGARAAWTKMLQLRPNHPGVQSAIDKLPAA